MQEEVEMIDQVSPPGLTQMSWPSPQRFVSPSSSRLSNTPQKTINRIVKTRRKSHIFSPAIRKLLEEEAKMKNMSAESTIMTIGKLLIHFSFCARTV